MSAGKLPEGWINTTIGDISVKCSQRVPDENEQFIYVDIGSINRELKVIENPQYLIGKDAPSRARKEIKAHDIIVSLTRPNLNAVALVSEKYDEQIASTGFEVIRPTLVESRYIFALVRSRHFIDSISGLVQGALYPAAKSSDVQSYEFPLPPLAEQKIIAEKLDTLLAQVDNTKARLKQIPQILKRFRQAVLAAAVTGRLTKEYNDCTKKTIELENYKISIPKKWNETILNNVINTQRPLCYGVVQPGDDINDGIELIRVCDINDGEVDLNHLRRISKEIDIQYKRSKVQKNDILITIVGAIGRIGIVRENINVNIARAVARVSPESKFIIPMFLHIWLSSPIMQTWLVQSSKEVARKTLNLKDLKEAFVPLPSIEEQHEIVRRVEQLFAWADTIEKQVNNALTRVNSLTQSILAKAFRGELTAQWRAENPELISGENSAAALLEKIKAERAASGGKKTSRKKA
ncbi:restriction endonuclease subunit S [Salmonella enterica subsp. enterica serovar Cerro]|uniref:restriction endonuclease subunit S n=1 Tax=Salmonella enterica TaxID=28901 RepID=UPI0012E4900D|nr:restriction endonuclease subunit S [Salmonella enterica]EBS5944687.1 restriction endonuclease subunit S [Salmonella enterica subsp. enterica serovar Cerro]EBV1477650.1 restriction endonuclease subunit S [Salmonella enterica subsp. enterica serovar Cerro]EGQ7592983.1 restriction endonuclease subunit S [Salmonella enterica subsp. enterica serovar Cerro]EHB1433996.1 restriction endonuclease subunit S [Salmonella enterica subsp. enterica serovar Cerro]MCU7122165.1 restriction endonuclease subun